MKKILIATFIIAGVFAVLPSNTNALSCAVNPDGTANCPQSPSCLNNCPTHSYCPVFTRDLKFGARGEDVTTLQWYLYDSYKLLTVPPTGYFGVLTRRAVAQYQAKNGIVPAVGYFGPITRGSLIKSAQSFCAPRPPDPTSPITITSPKGGEVWQRNSTQQITWTDKNVYIQAPKYDIKLQFDLDCKPNQPCILLYPMPITIAKNVMDTKFSWIVGSSTDPTRTIADGKYRVFVCGAGNQNQEDLTGCAKSASYVTIKSETISTTTITRLSPSSGPVGTLVRIYSTSLIDVNNINFGTGYISKDSIRLGIVSGTPEGALLFYEFTVPSGLNPACFYSTPRCMIPTIMTSPGTYNISVTNTSGVTSNSLPFTVMSSASGGY